MQTIESKGTYKADISKLSAMFDAVSEGQVEIENKKKKCQSFLEANKPFDISSEAEN